MIPDFIDRVNKVMKVYGYRNLSQLAKALGYSNSEKLSRLDRDRSNQPSYSIIIDISNLLDGINLNWLIAGEGVMLLADEQKRLGIVPGDTKELPSSVLDLEINKETVSVLHTNEPPEEYHGAKKSLLMVEVYIKDNQILEAKPVNVKTLENLKAEIDKNKEALKSLTRIVTRNLK